MLTNLRWMFLLTIVCEGMLFSPGVGFQANLNAQDQIAIEPQSTTNALELYERARSYSAAGDAQAEETYRQAIAARRGKYPEAWKWLSFYLAHELRFDEAETAWKKYLKQTHQKVLATEVERLNRLNRASLLKSQCDNGDVLSAEQMASWLA